MSEKPFRWAVIGTGQIATLFTEDVLRERDMTVTAVVSRQRERGAAFARRLGVDATVVESPAELAQVAAVDAVYIGTPHTDHLPSARAAMAAGLPVLCEKPMGISARQVIDLADQARRCGVFLMEAMWSRFLPFRTHLDSLLADGAIGEPRVLFAEFGIHPPYVPESRLFDPELGGGALLDVGIYPVALAQQLFGTPVRVTASAAMTPTAVDGQGAYTLEFANGALALLYGGLVCDTPKSATLCGTSGRLQLEAPFFRSEGIALERADGTREHWSAPVCGHGYGYEARAVMEAVRAGLTEHPAMPLDASIEVATTMDRLRAEWGLRYPRE